MTKAEFFEWCRRHPELDPDRADDRHKPEDYPLYVRVEREFRGLDYVVNLHGVWSGSVVLSVELYRPVPNRQWQTGYEVVNSRLEKERAKYQRWLDEFQSSKN